MKHSLFILSILMLFTACKPTSNIITSKDVAVKKGIYTEPVLAKNSTVKKKNVKRDLAAKKVLPTLNQKQNLKINDKNESDIVISKEDSNYLIEQLINSASDNLGVNYRAGGTTPAGFDCSGLMYSTFKKFDITLPRSSHEMAEVGMQIDPEKAKRGDLIFFINRGQKRINHVGMIVEVNGDEIKFIHSSTQGGVMISSLKESYYERTFKQINRVLE
ncbi:C40 family peptidase [Flavobacterium paronense]|uniref:C40 family peptidase n=1 Tax=Flavobacterium paronense TaxID=1392775 RepID=A0ABV5GDQ8_9FLAO|nr:C40 family peptidase [Flavobacterium paronense]MDN3678079.1 C40 family peptidase [Flavobacterium paronense]